MATIVTRTLKGSALTTAEMDANLNNLNNDKTELVDFSVTTAGANVGGSLTYNNTTGEFVFEPADVINLMDQLVDDNSPALGGDLDVGAFNITTTTPNGSIDLLPIGTGAVNIQGPNGIQVTGDNTDAQIFTATTNSNLVLRANGTGVIVLDDPSKLAGELDVNNQIITNNQTNGNIVLVPNGSGAVAVQSTSGLTVSSGFVTATDTDANLTLSADGTGYIALNQLGGVVVTETNASGFGVLTGDVSKGLGLLTNAGADTSSDPSVKLTNGGGVNISAGDTSNLSLNGDLIELNAATQITDIVSYAETIDQLLGVSGTLSVNPLDGPIKYVVPAGNITINGFTSPVGGQTVSFVIDQATNGSAFTLTLGAGILAPGGIAPNLTPLSNDLLTITCIDPVTPVYIANIVNDFQ